MAPDPHLCTLSYEEKAFLFFFFQWRFSMLVVVFLFPQTTYLDVPCPVWHFQFLLALHGGWHFFLFFSRLLSHRWQDKNWNAQLNWQNWRHFILILSFMYGKNIYTFISHSVSLYAEMILTSSHATAYKPRQMISICFPSPYLTWLFLCEHLLSVIRGMSCDQESRWSSPSKMGVEVNHVSLSNYTRKGR